MKRAPAEQAAERAAEAYRMQAQAVREESQRREAAREESPNRYDSWSEEKKREWNSRRWTW